VAQTGGTVSWLIGPVSTADHALRGTFNTMAIRLVEPRTSRLVLRQWRERDRGPFAALNADPSVMEYYPAVLNRTESDAMVDRCVEQLRRDGYGQWAVEVRASGEFIGFVGLAAPSWKAAFTPCTEIGWRLARSAWGHGYATEAARAALATAFGPAGLHEVVSFTTTGNLRSQKVMQRLGMTRDPAEDFDHPLVIDGPLRRHVLYRLKNDDLPFRPGHQGAGR
jgi:RimJ/RimL family protein N-acetyltransferase